MMAEEKKQYDGCTIGYYEQLLDTIRITDESGTTVQIPYAAIESFVGDVMKQKHLDNIKNSEDYLSSVFENMWAHFEHQK